MKRFLNYTEEIIPISSRLYRPHAKPKFPGKKPSDQTLNQAESKRHNQDMQIIEQTYSLRAQVHNQSNHAYLQNHRGIIARLVGLSRGGFPVFQVGQRLGAWTRRPHSQLCCSLASDFKQHAERTKMRVRAGFSYPREMVDSK